MRDVSTYSYLYWKDTCLSLVPDVAPGMDAENSVHVRMKSGRIRLRRVILVRNRISPSCCVYRYPVFTHHECLSYAGSRPTYEVG